METREFRLSAPGKEQGLSCDENGAFLGAVPLLKRSLANGENSWQPIASEQLSDQIGAQFGLPIDMSRKTGGLKTIADALNAGDIPRAQVATVLLGIPDPPPFSKSVPSTGAMIKFIRDLHWSGLIKIDWDPDEHPRWPAGAPDSQGGQFAPKGTDAGAPSAPDGDALRNGSDADREHHAVGGSSDDGVYRPSSDLFDHRATDRVQIAAKWPSNGPPDEGAVCARFARLCALLVPLILKGDAPPRYVQFHDHHIFPQQFRKYFEQRDIDIDQYTVTIDASTHLEGIHGAGLGDLPGQWNRAWAGFIERNPMATRQRIFDFAGQLMKRYGISSSEIHPYGQFP